MKQCECIFFPPPKISKTENQKIMPKSLDNLPRVQRARYLRMLFSPPEMLHEDGNINQDYFRPHDISLYRMGNSGRNATRETRGVKDKTLAQFEHCLRQITWSKELDTLLMRSVQRYGCTAWSDIIWNDLPNWDARELAERCCILLGLPLEQGNGDNAQDAQQKQRALSYLRSKYRGWRPLNDNVSDKHDMEEEDDDDEGGSGQWVPDLGCTDGQLRAAFEKEAIANRDIDWDSISIDEVARECNSHDLVDYDGRNDNGDSISENGIGSATVFQMTAFRRSKRAIASQSVQSNGRSRASSTSSAPAKKNSRSKSRSKRKRKDSLREEVSNGSWRVTVLKHIVLI